MEAVRCRPCALRYPRADGVYRLGPPFSANGTAPSFLTDRMRQLLAETQISGWEEALRRFTSEVLSGRLRAPSTSRWAWAKAKLTGTTWEDSLQDLVDPTRAGWKFLVDLRPDSRVLFLGPSWGAAPLALARSAAQVIVLDGVLDRLQVIAHQARAAGLDNLVLAEVHDRLSLPLMRGSVDLAVAPGLGEWLGAVGGARTLRPDSAAVLLRELRRVLTPDGQLYLGTANRYGVSRLLAPHATAATYSPRGLRHAAADAGFARCALFAPVPFSHKFHQILDLEHMDRMNLSADAYRTRGRLLRVMVKTWDVSNRNGAVEQRLYPHLPGVSAVLSTGAGSASLAERLLAHLGETGRVASGATHLARYFVRPKGVAVLVTGSSHGDGAIVRLPLDERAERACRHHHTALETLTQDARLPSDLRRLFPAPLAAGYFEGQPFFAETQLPGESGRRYYARARRRYDRAVVEASEILCALRRVTEEVVAIDEGEFTRLCGAWLAELRSIVQESLRPTLEALERWLRAALLGRRLPLGWQHGDLDFANLLYRPDNTVVGIIDFEVFEPRGLPLLDLLFLLARRPIRHHHLTFGTIFTRSILTRALPPLEAGLLAREMQLLGADERLYRALALCCWLNHLHLRRDSWLVRSPSWLEANLHTVVDSIRSVL